MEIYADEENGRVYVGNGRGPYTVVERDGSTADSFTPRGAGLVFGPDGGAYEDGFEEGRKLGKEEGARASARIARQLDAERRKLAFAVALRYRPLRLKSGEGRP